MKERICICMTGWSTGGTRSFVQRLISIMRGVYTIHVLAFRTPKEDCIKNCKFHNLNMFWRIRSFGDIAFSPHCFITLITYLFLGLVRGSYISLRYDIKKFFAQDAVFTGFYVTLLAKMVGGKSYIVDNGWAPNILKDKYLDQVRVIWFMKTFRPFFLLRFYQRILSMMISYTVKNADKIFIVSEDIEEVMIAHGASKDRIVRCPLPIDSHLFNEMSDKKKRKIRKKYEIPADKIVMGFVGRPSEHKGYSYFVDACGKLIMSCESLIGLMVVGGNAKEIKLDIKNKGGDCDIVIIEDIIADDMNEVYNLMDIFICSATFGAGYGLSNLEAMACGLPIIATDIGAIRRIIKTGETGILIPPEDSNAIVEAVFSILNSPDLKDTIRKNARFLIERDFSQNTFREIILNTLKEKTVVQNNLNIGGLDDTPN